MKWNATTIWRKGLVAGSLFSIFALGSCETSLENPTSTQTISQVADAVGEPGKDYVANELLVKFKNGVSESAKANVLAKISGKVSEKILTKAMERRSDKEGVLVVRTPLAAREALAKAKDLEEVEYAEPNCIYTHDATVDDTYYTNASLWGMYGDASTPDNQYGSQAAEAWALGNTGASTTPVYIGIIDEGYMHTHTDLAANAGKNPGEIAGNGVDDDGNTYVDDVYGWDFDGNNNSVFDGANDDHGTHVAGTIGAVGGNGIGVACVSWSVKLLSAKFLGQRGGTTANAIKAVDYFTDLKTRHGLNIVATNNSWGGGGFSQLLSNAIERANAAGILFIAAAGNGGQDGVGDNNDSAPHYPANYANENVISVASITSTGARSSFSNYGPISVDLGAPGSGIYSTVPASSKGKKGGITSGYASYSGTSMATPHVTGGVALYAATHSSAKAADIKAAILNSVLPTTSLGGRCTTGGRLNVSGF